MICLNDSLPPVASPAKNSQTMSPTVLNRVLEPHPDSKQSPLDVLEVGVICVGPSRWQFRFRGGGDVASVCFPKANTPSRQDLLWQHTCFEVFLMRSDNEYYEFNFAPSSQWAAYCFASYRQGMREQELASSPHINFESGTDSFILDATIDLRGILDDDVRLYPGMGLAAVIEDANGQVTYWALAHPSGEPDFHHADSFVGALPDNVG